MKTARTPNDLPISRIVAANIAAHRAHRGWSTRALAQATQESGNPIGPSTVSRIEKSARPGAIPVVVSVDQLVALAEAFGVPLDKLLKAPTCPACMDNPPAGFACRTCGATA